MKKFVTLASISIIVFGFTILGVSTGGIASDGEDSWGTFKTKVQEQIDSLNQKMEPLKKQMQDLGEEAEAEWEKARDDFRQASERISDELASLKGKSGDAWENGKKNINEAVSKMQEQYEKLKNKVKNLL